MVWYGDQLSQRAAALQPIWLRVQSPDDFRYPSAVAVHCPYRLKKGTPSGYFSSNRNQAEEGQPYLSVVLGRIFRLRERRTTVADEVQAGFVHFVSVLFIMAVNPVLLAGAGYERNSVAVGTGLATGLACILSGLISNLPFGAPRCSCRPFD